MTIEWVLGAGTADDLGTDVGTREGGRLWQYGVRRGVVSRGWWETVGHAEGDPVILGHDGKVHLAPERRLRCATLLPADAVSPKICEPITDSKLLHGAWLQMPSNGKSLLNKEIKRTISSTVP